MLRVSREHESAPIGLETALEEAGSVFDSGRRHSPRSTKAAPQALGRRSRAAGSHPARSSNSANGSAVPNAERREVATERIVGEAARLFITQGYNATTVEQIAAASGYTKGAVYFYFSSKSGLLMDLVERIETATIEPAIAAVSSAGDNARDQLIAFLHAEAVVGSKSALYMLLAISMVIELNAVQDPVAERLQSLMDKLSNLLEQVVEKGQSQGVFRRDLPSHELTSFLMAVNTGCFVESRRRIDDVPGKEFVRTMRKMVLAGIEAR